MIDEETLAQINGKYVCPPDAGPAWRKLWESGEDMTLLEDSLAMTPQERISVHNHFRDQLLAIYASNPANSTE